MNVNQNPEVKKKFDNYPPVVKEKLLGLRQLIIDTAEHCAILSLEETLKWGEPSYLSKKGSTIRIDWKSKTPEQYAIYFKCTSKLVPTFKTLFKDLFKYEKNRAIVFSFNDSIPTNELSTCIRLALTYHTIKHLPNLGVEP